MGFQCSGLDLKAHINPWFVLEGQCQSVHLEAGLMLALVDVSEDANVLISERSMYSIVVYLPHSWISAPECSGCFRED